MSIRMGSSKQQHKKVKKSMEQPNKKDQHQTRVYEFVLKGYRDQADGYVNALGFETMTGYIESEIKREGGLHYQLMALAAMYYSDVFGEREVERIVKNAGGDDQ